MKTNKAIYKCQGFLHSFALPVPAIEKAIKNPEWKTKTEKPGFIVDYKSPAESRKLAAEDYERALVIAEKLGIRK